MAEYGYNKTFTMCYNPQNDKRGAFIRDLKYLRDSMVRNANNDIPISDVIDILDFCVVHRL